MMRLVVILLLVSNVCFGQTFKQDTSCNNYYKTHFNFNYTKPKVRSYYNQIYPSVVTTGRIVLSVKSNESFQVMTRIPLNTFYTREGFKTGMHKFLKHLVLVVPKGV